MAIGVTVLGLVAAGLIWFTPSKEMTAAQPETSAPMPSEVLASDVEREDGAALYSGRACAACHHPTKDQSPFGLGPSVKMIKAGYAAEGAGGAVGIARFLNGEGPAIINPELYPIMKDQVAITKAMTPAQRMALAVYLMK